jgi:phytoene dehydrogenase-like protein
VAGATESDAAGERAETERLTVDVAVVGAGLAGLTAAVTAARSGATVAVLDAGRPGGRARTATVDPGVVFNAGPRALYKGGAAARGLASLGVRWSGGMAPVRGSKASVGGAIHVLPGSPTELVRTGLLGARSKVQIGRLLSALPKWDAASVAGTSVSDWVDSFDLRSDAAALLHAVLRLATYVDAPAEMDAGAALAQLQMSLDCGVEYLDHGWQPLVDQLAGAVVDAGGAVADHRAVQALTRSADGGWILDTASGPVNAAAVVLATGTPAGAAGLCPVPLALDGIGQPATAACLELAVRGTPPTRFLLGIDEPLYLSEHAPPARLAPDGIGVVHVARYGATADAAVDKAQLQAHAAAAGIDPESILAERFLRRMVVMGGVPLAAAGGLAGRPSVRVDGADALFLAGDWVGDEGILADAAVASGVRAGELAAAARRSAPAVAAG